MSVAITEPPFKTTGLTYADYLCLPDIELPYEIIEGELIMSPAATSYHQWLVLELVAPLTTFVREHKLGVVLLSPVDVIIRKEPKMQTRQPDVLFLSTARTGITGSKELRQMPQIELAPDLAVEVLSPDDRRKTLNGKMKDYAAIGVLELWLVSINEETIEVLKLDGTRYERMGLYEKGDTLMSPVLPGFTLDVAAVFA